MNGMRKRNILAALILIALGIGFAFLTSQLPMRNIENATGPSFFPWIVTVIFLALSFALLVQGFLPKISDDLPSIPKISARRYLIGLIAFVAYLAVLPVLGFVAANILLFGVLMALYGDTRPVWVVGGSCAVSLSLFFLFRDVFLIRLPAGVLAEFLT